MTNLLIKNQKFLHRCVNLSQFLLFSNFSKFHQIRKFPMSIVIKVCLFYFLSLIAQMIRISFKYTLRLYKKKFQKFSLILIIGFLAYNIIQISATKWMVQKKKQMVSKYREFHSKHQKSNLCHFLIYFKINFLKNSISFFLSKLVYFYTHYK